MEPFPDVIDPKAVVQLAHQRRVPAAQAALQTTLFSAHPHAAAITPRRKD